MSDPYRFQLSRDMSVAVALGRWGSLVFPRLDQRAAELRAPLVAVLALAESGPVGLALAQLLPEQRAAEILSCFVLPEHRGRGIGRRLIGSMERALARQGVATAQLAFRDAWSGTPALRRILDQRGWEPPQPRLLLGKSTQKLFADAAWLDRARVPPRFSIVPWMAVTEAERAALRETQGEQPWYPELLSPFQLPERVELLNSLALRRDRDVIGWIITHRLDQRTIQYTSLFVRPPFQRRAVALLAASIRRQQASDLPFGIFQVALDNAAMARFARRRLAPYLSSLHTLYATSKRFESAS